MPNETHVGPVILSKDGCDVIRCESCGFSHIMPIPSEEDLAAFYKEEFYANEKPDYLTSSHADFDWLELGFSDRFELFEETLGRTGSVLDIGSGPGNFLETGKKRGWEITGVEPSSQASEYANSRGLNTLCTFLTPDTFDNRSEERRVGTECRSRWAR